MIPTPNTLIVVRTKQVQSHN